MNYTTKDNWHYSVSDGYYFKKGDCIASELYLGKYDNIENWSIITEAEKQVIETEQEKQHKAE